MQELFNKGVADSAEVENAREQLFRLSKSLSAFTASHVVKDDVEGIGAFADMICKC